MTTQSGATYRHYKGSLYRVLHIAHHTETHEALVIYQDTAAPDKIWARPQTMFEEDVIVDGQTIKRFTPVSDDT